MKIGSPVMMASISTKEGGQLMKGIPVFSHFFDTVKLFIMFVISLNASGPVLSLIE